MIEILGVAGLAAFVLSSGIVGGRLLWLGRRTRGAPEIALGIGLVAGCLLGYVPEYLVFATDLVPPRLADAVLAATQIAIRLAALAVLYFTATVFRPRSLRARVFASSVALALVMSWMAFPLSRAQAQTGRDLFWYEFFAVTRTLAVAWAAAEAFLHWRRLRRRLRLGLAEALTTHRFLTWGVGMSAMAVLMSTTLLADAVGVSVDSARWMALESAAGMVGAGALWLTFFPGRWYAAWVEARAARPRRTAPR